MINDQLSKKKEGLFERIYEVVRQIPEGKVTTYGEIARVLELRDVRKVGFALHANPYPPSSNQNRTMDGRSEGEVPCHRVVNKEGRLAPNFAFDGMAEQRRRLEAEGVEFVSEDRVDMEKYFFSFQL